MVECTKTAEKTCGTVGLSPTPSESSRCDLLIATIVFFITLACLFPLVRFASISPDEGMTLDGAERILRGQVPYRDFFMFFTPASYYVNAYAFKLFGHSLVVARSVLLVVFSLFCSITYLLVRKMYSQSTSLIASILVFDCSAPAFESLHNWYSSLFALIAIFSAYRLLHSYERRWPFLLGIAASLTFLTEQSKGAGLLLGLIIAVLALLIRNRGIGLFSISQLSWALAGFALPILGTVAYFASQHSLAAMLASWLWPMRHYSIVGRVPYGFFPTTPEEIVAMFGSAPWMQRVLLVLFGAPYLLIPALAVMVIATTFYWIGVRGKVSFRVDNQVLGGSIFLGIWLSVLATGRADLSHIMYVAPLFVYLIPSILDFQSTRTVFLKKIRPLVASFLLLSFCGFGFVAVLGPLRVPTFRSRRGNVRIPQEDQVIAYFQSTVGEGDHVYVHPYQPFYSYMTDTVNPTSYQFLFPGMNTPEQYSLAIQELSADRTRFVLIDPGFRAKRVPRGWPSTPIEALVVDPVSDYILRNYRLCRILNPQPSVYYFMVRKDLSCPSN